MESVYLRYPSNEYYVSDEGYQEIVSLINAHKLCMKGWHPYTKDNPCVGRNLCLEHLLQQYGSLTFMGVPRTDLSGRRVYRYLNKESYIYTSTEDISTEATKDLDETLAYHGFAPPKSITYRDRTTEFSSYYATLYGDFKTASVIVMNYEKRSSELIKGVFLLYKDGTHKPFVKNGEHKHLFTRAKALLEATKDQRGEYHLPWGTTTCVLYEEYNYPIISQLESAMFDVVRKLQPQQPAKEDMNEPEQPEQPEQEMEAAV